MKRIPAIKAAMTPFPYSVHARDSLADAQAMMEQHGIRHLPVMNRERLASVISDREILATLDARGGRADKIRIGEIALPEAYVVELTEPLDVVLLHMARTHTHCALVVKEGKLVGIFTITDACRCFGEMLREMFPRGGGDEAA
jgi:acetoin utilization protein AcuB